MDCSSEYIKMCNCPEIQGIMIKDEFINGDWFAYYEPKAFGKRYEKPHIQVVGSTFYEFTRDYLREHKHLSIVGYDEGDCELVWGNEVIWLPRQDQIQEMVKKDSINIELNKFYVFCLEKNYAGHNLPTAIFSSLEQLWLAFYMYEKHNKIWNGEKWIKS